MCGRVRTLPSMPVFGHWPKVEDLSSFQSSVHISALLKMAGKSLPSHSGLQTCLCLVLMPHEVVLVSARNGLDFTCTLSLLERMRALSVSQPSLAMHTAANASKTARPILTMSVDVMDWVIGLSTGNA